MTLVYRDMTPEEKLAAEAWFLKVTNETRAAAEADPTHPSRPYFGLPMGKPSQASPTSFAEPSQEPSTQE